jgi:hypothetical protein
VFIQANNTCLHGEADSVSRPSKVVAFQDISQLFEPTVGSATANYMQQVLKGWHKLKRKLCVLPNRVKVVLQIALQLPRARLISQSIQFHK